MLPQNSAYIVVNITLKTPSPPLCKFRMSKRLKCRVKGMNCVIDSPTLPIHTAWTTVWSYGLCRVLRCHGWHWIRDILVSSSKTFPQSVQWVAAALTVSHMGRRCASKNYMAASMITCFMQYMWIFTQRALISFFPTETNALIQVVIMLKSSVHVCVHIVIKSVHSITCSVTEAVGTLLSGHLS
jgi:hypothetical protein